MHEYGYRHQTVALAVHGLAALQPGTVGVSGIQAGAIVCLSETALYPRWRDFLSWPDATGGRTACPIPIFYRACQGHSALVASIERMYAPYDPGLARCHGPLLHITDMDTL
eukprot:4176855-Pyramimonas_sp.AAC.1